MSARLGFVLVLITLSAILYWNAGSAYSQDVDYYYICEAPDGTIYYSAIPCEYDYNYADPGFLFFDLDIGRRHHDRSHHRDRHSDHGRHRGRGSEHGHSRGGGGTGHEGGHRGR